jgi:diacylglycerol kinase (ATP)
MSEGRTSRAFVVVNPRSAGGKTGEIFSAMRPTIEKRLGPIDVALTERTGHAIDLAEQAVIDGRHFLVAVGGDGTLNEVVNGIMRGRRRREADMATATTFHGAPQVTLGLIGQGTGGDFCRGLGIEHRLDRYLDALTSGRERKLDVGRARYRDESGTSRERWFVNILSAGIGGLVDRYVADASRGLGGKAAYFTASVRALVVSRRARLVCRITRVDDTTEERTLETFMLAICNGQYFGSGMHVAPMANVSDGQLEVVSIGGAGKIGWAMNAVSVYSGAHLEKPGTVHFACKKIDIELATPEAEAHFLLDCDGEPIGRLPLSVELEPAAVRFRG